MRPLLVAVGTVSLGLGVFGMFVPILPTTPFLLMAVYCYARSSERLHRWLITHPRIGVYLVGFVYGGGIPLRAKRAALLTLWPGIALSCVIIAWRVTNPIVRIGVPMLIVAIAVAVTVFIVTRPECADTPEGPDPFC